MVFLGLRALHVLVAGIWIGSTTFLAVVLMPAIDAAGPAGGQVMLRLSTRNTTYMTSLGVATILSGIYLLWRFTGGFDGGVLASHAGKAFSIGGAAGILAVISLQAVALVLMAVGHYI